MKADDIIIIIACLFGFIGGILLFFLTGIPILVSWFIGIGTAALVYRFLGGIPQDASITIKTFKIGGTLAALIGVVLIINYYLTNQTSSFSRNEFFSPLANTWTAIDNNKYEPVSLRVSDKIKIAEGNQIEFDPNIFKDKELFISEEQTEDRCPVKANKGFLLGYLRSVNIPGNIVFKKIQLTKDFSTTNRLKAGEHTEIPQFGLRLSTQTFDGNGFCQYRLSNGTDKIHEGLLKNNQGEIIEYNGKRYLIAVVEANFSTGESETMYAKLAIFELKI